MFYVLFSERLEIQLIGGTRSEGIVVVEYRGEYKGICDTHWEDRAAKVVCAQLGYR